MKFVSLSPGFSFSPKFLEMVVLWHHAIVEHKDMQISEQWPHLMLEVNMRILWNTHIAANGSSVFLEKAPIHIVSALCC